MDNEQLIADMLAAAALLKQASDTLAKYDTEDDNDPMFAEVPHFVRIGIDIEYRNLVRESRYLAE